MAFSYFANALNNGMIPQPNDMYRDIQQAFINEQWDNTTALYTIKEQTAIGAKTYQDVPVWINRVVGESSTGRKDGNDFIQLTFENIDYVCIRGWYYIFEDNYWISYFMNEYSNVVKDMNLRRCNNFMRIVDPENGSIFSAPCVVDYEMASPSIQVTSNILTPNNHATVMVQGNDDTLRLFQTNTRYILGGRPFKLYGIQNAILDDLSTPRPTLLYLDLYLDEKRANDDFNLQLADNGTYQYAVKINATNMELTTTSTGKLAADITLNGQEVDRAVLWNSSNETVVTIEETGSYDVVGSIGSTAIIKATLNGNPDIFDTIQISVVDASVVEASIIIDPSFDSIREFETKTFVVESFYGGTIYEPTTSQISLSNDSIVLENQYLSIAKNGNQYRLTCLKRTPNLQTLYLNVENTAPLFTAKSTYTIELTSMMG